MLAQLPQLEQIVHLEILDRRFQDADHLSHPVPISVAFHHARDLSPWTYEPAALLDVVQRIRAAQLDKAEHTKSVERSPPNEYRGRAQGDSLQAVVRPGRPAAKTESNRLRS